MKQSTLNLPVPVVRFEYPDRETNLLKTRFVRVVSMDDNYIKGYELPQHNGKPLTETERTPLDPQSKFKQFNMRRIAKDSIILVAHSYDY